MSAVTPELIKRIHAGIDASEKRMRHFRERRLEGIQAFLGRHYGARRKGVKATPFNMIAQASMIYVANLVARAPTYRVRATKKELRPYAASFELALNHVVRRMEVEETLREAVADSIMGFAVVKSGLGEGNYVDTLEGKTDSGAAFVDRVSPDDYILDPSARDQRHADFEGDRYRLPLAYVKESEEFENTDKLRATHEAYRPDTDAEQLSQPDSKVPERELEEYVELYDIWLPREGLLLTLSTDEYLDRPVRTVEWEGPEEGPYLMLAYNKVPDNALPLPPVGLWQDLHEWINAMARKMKRQSERAKKILAYEDRSADDAQRIVGADDGETVKATNLDGIKEVEFGGSTPFAEGMIQFLIQMFSREAGNIDYLGGLAARARTATEASMVGGQASLRLGDMQREVYKFTKSVGEQIAWYLFTDPAVEIPITKRLAQLGIEVSTVFSPEVRAGGFPDYVLEVEPYSMAPRDPQEYLRMMMQWWTSVVLPTLPIAAQQGGSPNVLEFWRLMGKEMGIPEVDELLLPGAIGQAAMGPEQPMPQMNLPNQASGNRMSRGEYQTSQTFNAAQRTAPKPQAASPIKAVGGGVQ